MSWWWQPLGAAADQGGAASNIDGTAALSFANAGNPSIYGGSDSLFSNTATLTGKGALAGTTSFLYTVQAATLSGPQSLAGSSSLIFSVVGNNTPNAVAIFDNANTTVTYTSPGVAEVEKTSGVTAYNASAISGVGITGDFTLRLNLLTLVGGILAGMNTDPLTDNDYVSVDYGWGNPGPINGDIYESGSLLSSPGGATYHWIWRSGSTLGYGRGATIAAAQAAPDRTTTETGALYFDSSLYAVGDKVEVRLTLPGEITGTSSLTFASTSALTGTGALAGSSSIRFQSLGGRKNLIGIYDRAYTTVTYTADIAEIERTGGAGGYVASAVSSFGVSGDFVLRAQATAIVSGSFVGVNSDPETDNDYASIDYAWAIPSGSGQIYESGALISTPGTATYFWIWRTGTTLGYGRGATLATAQASPDRTQTTSATLYFDSSLGGVGDKLQVQFTIPGDIAGTSTLTFASTSALVGTGVLAGTSTLVFSHAAPITGKGALAGSAALTFTPTSTLTGKGPLAGTATLVFAHVATTGLVGSSTLVFSHAAPITGKGTLAGTSTLVFTPAATATGNWAASGSSSLVFGGTGSLDLPSGGTSGTTAFVLSSAGTLIGSAAAAGVSSLVFASTAPLDAPGVLSGVSSVSFGSTGAVTGEAQLAGSSAIAFSSTANLAALSLLDASASVSFVNAGLIHWLGVVPGGSSRPYASSRRNYGSSRQRTMRSGSQRSYASARGR